eukprot:6192955-Pleurochrysis_carterae.AAC.3
MPSRALLPQLTALLACAQCTSALRIGVSVARQQVAIRPSGLRSPSPIALTEIPVADVTSPPRNRAEMLSQVCMCTDASRRLLESCLLAEAAAATERAREAGVTRGILRLMLPRGGGLVPPDESWEGGIMQLFAVTSPLTRDLLKMISKSIAGVPPAMSEQRLDASGVDGESVWMAQSSRPTDDGVAFVQPSAEVLGSIENVCKGAGDRPVLMVNPQWREGDDPLDALSRQVSGKSVYDEKHASRTVSHTSLHPTMHIDASHVDAYPRDKRRILLEFGLAHMPRSGMAWIVPVLPYVARCAYDPMHAKLYDEPYKRARLSMRKGWSPLNVKLCWHLSHSRRSAHPRCWHWPLNHYDKARALLQGGVVGAIGCFLGGKAATERKIAELGFEPIYTLAQFSCRGSQITLMRTYPTDWNVFVEQPDGARPEFLFSSAERPTYQLVEEMLEAKGVPFRFASELFSPNGILPDSDK